MQYFWNDKFLAFFNKFLSYKWLLLFDYFNIQIKNFICTENVNEIVWKNLFIFKYKIRYCLKCVSDKAFYKCYIFG